MFIKISRNELLRQIESQGAKLPEYIVLNGEMTEGSNIITKIIPTAYAIFTPKEILLVKRLLEADGTIVSVRSLEDCINYEGYSNTIVVHIKSIRKKIQDHSLPMSIKTIRGIGFQYESN